MPIPLQASPLPRHSLPLPLSTAFIDSDEFLVITDGTPDLPTLLRDYERYGGLAANWRILGSSERRGGGPQRGACSLRHGLGSAMVQQLRVGAGSTAAWCAASSQHPLRRATRRPGVPRASSRTSLVPTAGGHQAHQDSTLLAYTACYPPRQREQLLTKSVVNTAWAVQPAAPHNAYYVGGCHAGRRESESEGRCSTAASERSLRSGEHRAPVVLRL